MQRVIVANKTDASRCNRYAGVVNVVNGGVSTGEEISHHMDIDKVFFTGSVRAGKAIAQACAASNLKQT
jgi:acyl-CoA reductase-like NAD-dependent aldehyde dehydrogenase